uniref:Putative secreted protein n=1 Tax=Ixodes ricinus TaxID=34613 RepID=A0A6B0UII7_IXORI
MRKRGSVVRGEFLLPLFSTAWVTPSHLWQGLSSAMPPSLRSAQGGRRVHRVTVERSVTLRVYWLHLVMGKGSCRPSLASKNVYESVRSWTFSRSGSSAYSGSM